MAAAAGLEATRILQKQLALEGGMTPTAVRMRGRGGEGGGGGGVGEGDESQSVTDQLAGMSKRQLCDLMGHMKVGALGVCELPVILDCFTTA